LQQTLLTLLRSWIEPSWIASTFGFCRRPAFSVAVVIIRGKNYSSIASSYNLGVFPVWFVGCARCEYCG